MEVMNDSRFEQTNVLVGSSGQTKNFGVSADPMLMSMLSTGLYANPLRTMIQEIMFNAWDAHRMGNCQDRPIDVYLNDTSGLIVRDYGPGIHPDDVHGIYCIYGNSTKRNDKGQTGGFGLGSKSPFAYTDSFMVTNHHAGKKYMYVVNRACDENNGGPGMTPIIEGVDTEETGLIVTVPFKNDRDRQRAYDYIKDILFLSGIKINIHFEEEEMETIESASLEPSEYINDDKHGHAGLWAVYGGVRYKIEKEDAYATEYAFLAQLSQTLGTFFIGFEPDSLTPLPNREGLNLSDKTVETLKSQMETMQEAFMAVCKPATRAAMDATMSVLKETGIQPQFLAYRWKDAGSSTSFQKMVNDVPVLTGAQNTCPDGVGENLWTSMVMMAFKHTDQMAQLIGRDQFNTMRGIVFVKEFPKWMKHLNYLTDGSSYRSNFDTKMQEHGFPEFVRSINKTLKILQEVTGQSDLHLRMNLNKNNSLWHRVSGIRGGKKHNSHSVTYHTAEIIKRQLALGTLKEPTKPVLDRLWSHVNGEEIKSQMLQGVIIIAQTATSLNESKFSLQQYFSPGYHAAWKANPENMSSTPRMNSYHSYHSSKFRWNDSVTMVPAIVIHKKKDGYNIAKETLKKMGYIVLEADLPSNKRAETSVDAATFIGPPSTSVSKKKEKPTFPVLDYMNRKWASDTWIENPQTYFCCTIRAIRGYNSYEKPSNGLLLHAQQRWPRTVVLHNKQRESILVRMKVPNLPSKIDTLVRKLLTNKERLRTMYLHAYAKEHSELPDDIMAIPEMQKMFHIPYLRTSQKEQFEKDWAFLHTVMGENSNYVFRSTRSLIKESLASYEKDPSVSVVRKMCDQTQLFNDYKLRHHIRGMKPGEKKVFSQNIARFLRTV